MSKNKKLILISVFVCLALVLDYIKSFIPFLNMPSGGSINIALVPIVYIAFYLGYQYGIIAGLLWWLISSLLGLNNYILSIPQYIVDYVLPSGIVGICSLFYKKKTIVEMEIGLFIMMTIRTLLLVISGAYFWPGDLAAGSIAAWTFSLAYNVPYSLVTYFMIALVTPFIVKRTYKHML